ncbi:MAG: hypothetical protein AAFV53_15085 [Myxococcota bacterium]
MSSNTLLVRGLSLLVLLLVIDDVRLRVNLSAAEQQARDALAQVERLKDAPQTAKRDPSLRRRDRSRLRSERARPFQRRDPEDFEARVQEEVDARVEGEVEGAVNERIQARFRRRLERRRASVQAGLDAYIEEQGLSEAQEEELRLLFEGSFAEMEALWDRRSEEGADRFALREEMMGLRQEMQADLVSLLGEEEASALQQQLQEARRPGGDP